MPYNFLRYHCPIFNREMDETECFHCAMSMEGWGPMSTAEEMRALNPDADHICLECEHHPPMEDE